jgi:hypothetical protein
LIDTTKTLYSLKIQIAVVDSLHSKARKMEIGGFSLIIMSTIRCDIEKPITRGGLQNNVLGDYETKLIRLLTEV